jgi:hypothetical protein
VQEYDNSEEFNKNWVSQDEILEARKVRTEKKRTNKKIFSEIISERNGFNEVIYEDSEEDEAPGNQLLEDVFLRPGSGQSRFSLPFD